MGALLICGLIALLVLWRTRGLAVFLIDGALRCVFTYRDIFKPDGSLYLRRFYVTPRSWIGPGRWPRLLSFVPVRFRKIFLHRILQSDERTPHDHPWPFTSVILAGEYLERCFAYGREVLTGVPAVLESTRRCPRGTVIRNRAEHIHRLEIVRPVWSLVFAGPAFREWGFWDAFGMWDSPEWIDWRTFLGCPNAPTEPEDAFIGDPFYAIDETEPVTEVRGYPTPKVCGCSSHLNCLPSGDSAFGDQTGPITFTDGGGI